MSLATISLFSVTWRRMLLIAPSHITKKRRQGKRKKTKRDGK